MGAAGSGKTVVGRALAAELGWPFADADDFHSAANVEKMRRGIGLTDADREPWLAAMHQAIARAAERREHLALACSALKERYRQTLRGDVRGVRFVHLEADEATLARRLRDRQHHFAGPSLLASQLRDLEPPCHALTVDATQPIDRIVAAIRYAFGL